MNNNITSLLVDDEASARENLRTLLDQYCPQVHITDEAANVTEATRSVRHHRPDLVFLDIEMPGRSGFGLINDFHSLPFHVIFVTAYDRHALRAFEVSAIDYLLKPVDTDRLQAAVQKVALKKEQQSYKARLEALKTNAGNQSPTKLAIPHKGDYDIVAIDDIIAIEAERMYSRLSISDPNTRTIRHYTYSKKLSHFEDLFRQLPHFHRAHRSWIVNTRFMAGYSRRDHTITLRGHTQIPVSKSYRPGFEASIGF